MIKRFFKSFTFKFMLLSLALIYLQINGRDTKSLLLIEMNVILNYLVDLDSVRIVLDSGPMIESKTMSRATSLYVYVLHFLSFIIYGLAFDVIKKIIKREE